MPKYGGPISFLCCAYQCGYWTGAECKLMYSLLACYMDSIVLYEIMWILDIYKKKRPCKSGCNKCLAYQWFRSTIIMLSAISIIENAWEIYFYMQDKPTSWFLLQSACLLFLEGIDFRFITINTCFLWAIEFSKRM